MKKTIKKGKAYKGPDKAYSGGYSYVYRKRRTKSDWSGIALGDAFRQNLDYYLRQQAQRKFYHATQRAQIAAVRLAGDAGAHIETRVKPQLSPCYTTYPATLGAYAAIGLTAFLEFQERIDNRLLAMHLGGYLKNPAQEDDVEADPEYYARTAQLVTEYVQNRLLLTEIARTPSLSAVEIYRLFSASQQGYNFEYLGEILRAVIYYGDVLPDWREQKLHPLTYSVLQRLTATCAPYFERLAASASHELPQLGCDWVRAICVSLAEYLPAPREETSRLSSPGPTHDYLPSKSWFNNVKVLFPRMDEKPDKVPDLINPLDDPKPPALFRLQDVAAKVMNSFAADLLGKQQREQGDEGNEASKPDPAQKTLAEFSQAIQAAGGQDEKLEDMRSDLIERAMRLDTFSKSPIQGNPVEGHEIQVRMGAGREATGELFDRPVELSGDFEAHEQLLSEAAPITDALCRSLYPNVQQIPVTERLRSGGSLDPARLALAEFSATIFKRYRIREQPDRRGRPLLVIACDGSGSLNKRQMKMVKVLAAGWLQSTARGEVQVLAALYHSGEIREGLSGPLVQWIYHPRKSPAVGRREATRAVVTLPEDGTGIQADALSLAFIMEEARLLARRNMTYLILISDTQWNRCLQKGISGAEEVYGFFQETYATYPGKLHTTLVALGVEGETGFEDLLDRVITVPDAELQDYGAVAKKIGLYVASCMRERQALRVVGGG